MKATSIRILSYNIHQGKTVDRRKLSFRELREAIQSQKPDLVLLQEVAERGDEKQDPEANRPLQLEALMDKLMPHSVYGRNAVFTGGFHGNAILSRYPILETEQVDISVGPSRKRSLRFMPKRGLLHAKIEMPGHTEAAHIIGTHFGLLQLERHAQLKKLTDFIKSRVPVSAPLILGGDFNDWRQVITSRLEKTLNLSEAFTKFHARHAKTFPSKFPFLCLDRIYFRELNLMEANRLTGKPWHFLSDHLPLIAEFMLPQAQKLAK
jgi:endonuclease/exonuclease/phosphatase family metal-dependent hydrolase